MNRWQLLPNFLSCLRIILIFPICFLILKFSEDYLKLIILLYLLAIFLDFLDGFLARKLNAVSVLGKILDPLADKLLTLSLIFVLVLKADFPFWLAIAIFFRDFFILFGSWKLMQRKIGVKPSILVGKFTFGLLALLVFVYLLDISEFIALKKLKLYLIPLTFSFLFWSYFEYYKIYRELK